MRHAPWVRHWEIICENDSLHKFTSWQPWLRVASPLNGKYLVETTWSARRCSKKPLFFSYARHYSTTRFRVPFADESTNEERQLSWKTSAKRIRSFSFWNVFIDTSASALHVCSFFSETETWTVQGGIV